MKTKEEIVAAYQRDSATPNPVTLSGVDMTFGEMVKTILLWTIAFAVSALIVAIPVAIVYLVVNGIT